MTAIENKAETEALSLTELMGIVKSALTSYKTSNTKLLKAWFLSSQMYFNNVEIPEAQMPLLKILYTLDEKDAAIFRRLTGQLFPNVKVVKPTKEDGEWPFKAKLACGENGPGLHEELAKTLDRMVLDGGWSFRSKSFAEKINEVMGVTVSTADDWDWEKSVDALVKRIEKHGHAMDVLTRLRTKLAETVAA